jgi:hypothetical protein
MKQNSNNASRTRQADFRATSLKNAERMVRRLQKQVADRDELLERFDRERKLLAKLAADTPQFYNPLHVMEARRIRDSILLLQK